MKPVNIRLRLEAHDGRTAREYRIQNGTVEQRTLHIHSSHNLFKDCWHRLTSEELSLEVERNTILAQWLERRLGWRRLLHACLSQEARDEMVMKTGEDRLAA